MLTQGLCSQPGVKIGKSGHILVASLGNEWVLEMCSITPEFLSQVLKSSERKQLPGGKQEDESL